MLDTPLRATVITLGLIVLAASLLACVPVQPTVLSGAASTPAPTPDADDKDRPAGWTEETHSNDVAPNYYVVFPIDAVNTIKITLAPDDWAAQEASGRAWLTWVTSCVGANSPGGSGPCAALANTWFRAPSSVES